MCNTKVIAYYRVSTKKQGASGLGLEAQRAAVEQFTVGKSATILRTYTEIETGKDSERPELAKALEHARLAGATLVIGKLDRLARNVAFTSALMRTGVNFIALDCPYADKFTIHVLAAVAEKEAEDISARTKAALAARKARGLPIGGEIEACRNLTQAAREKGAKRAGAVVKANADKFAAQFRSKIEVLRAEGNTLQQIADLLNQEGYTTARGKQWTHVQVKLLLERV